MPSSQQRLSTETSKGLFASAYTFSVNSWKGLMGKVGRASDNMTKPGNVGAPQPMNTLFNNSVSSRTVSALPSHSRPSSSNPPPAKRQRVGANLPQPAHSEATFALVGPEPTPKPSIESESIPDSQRSVVSNKTAGPAVPEFWQVEKQNKRRRFRRNRDDSKSSAKSGSPIARLVPPQRSEEIISDDEVDLVNHLKQPVASHQSRIKQSEGRFIEEYAPLFQRGANPTPSDATQAFSAAIDRVDKRARHRGPDPGSDELGTSDEEYRPARAAKRSKTAASSLSNRGNIHSTKFSGPSSIKSSDSMDAQYRLADKQKDDASTVIKDGLHIKRGVSGNYRYIATDEDAPKFPLSIREIAHTLYPVDDRNEILKQYRYLTLDIKKTKAIMRSDEDDDCFIIHAKYKSLNLANGAGPGLMLEFASEPEYQRFLQWVHVYRNPSSPDFVKGCKRSKLEKDFNEMIGRTKSSRILSDDEINASTPEDIKLMQHNHQNRSVRDNHATVDTRRQPRIRDAMGTSPILGSNSSDIASNRALEDQAGSVSRQKRVTREKPIYHERAESPELEPIPEGWTSLNAGWEKQWRNSLVYPKTGKNRATVDKEDIQRLDEGQFLNDNLIIFYLRYLQNELEKTNPALAERIYFQNTFFYDKLKPKQGGRINYDSVKNWTAKVDIFAKDYIIVPINEFTHWYVAIICNAPKLLANSNGHEREEDLKNEVISIVDGNETSRGNSVSPSRSVITHGTIDEQVSQVRGEQIVEGLRRMSIDSCDHPNEATKNPADRNAGETSDPNSLERDNNGYVVKDSNRPEAEVEHITTTTCPQKHRKPGKKSTGGVRNDPNMPRIITLDSLGNSHSPTCIFLKQYLIAESKDKKGIEISPPKNMGTTAKGVPEQTNHCDCGLYLLGYIQQFLHNPDDFVKCLLQRDSTIDWSFDPSNLRNSIRELIFDLQKAQQANEDEIQERKRQAKANKASKMQGPSAHTATQGMLPDTSKEPAGEFGRGDETEKAKSTSSASQSLASLSRPGSAGAKEVTPPVVLVDSESAKKQSTTNYSNGLTTTRHVDVRHGANIEEAEASCKAPLMAASPYKREPTSDKNAARQAASASPISPTRGAIAKRNSMSPETERSSNLQASFLSPLAETPSSKGSRGATPLDPVLVDDSESKQNKSCQSSPGRPKGQIVVELKSINAPARLPKKSMKTNGHKQTEGLSPFFSNRHPGDRISSVRVISPPPNVPNQVIDLSDD